ncbi:hypothetical protein E6C50_01850 [Flavobacterium supellecticarium]|uniref:Uncharacterized protein n=1 Tax=Flavobacterium supellecticarium TaxID=2565924 RepID=A0A4S4A4V3_9FLAO|nr:hypothetical protein [Flavobacterium supellecticarium]THF52975.1 hypothetical protein E6C50_01850 [Flavobacterium supellecticarium]
MDYEREKNSIRERTFTPIYLQVEQGFLFRFPFPDEDRLQFGRIIDPHDRTVDIVINKSVRDKIFGACDRQGESKIGIAMQKPVHRRSDGQFCLALVFKDQLTGELYRIEEPFEAKLIASQIVRHHILNETDQDRKKFYREIACRMLKGYRAGLQIGQYRDLHSAENQKINQEVRDGSEIELRQRKKGKSI